MKSQDQIKDAMAILGYTKFRSSEQEQLITAIAQGEDALGIMPTGAGKSACFIVPTLLNGWKTVVITPLISLMGDQVMKLRARNIPAFAISSETDPFEILEAMITVQGTPGRPAFLYASPEMLLSEAFRRRFKNFKPDLLAVDEAHCVSTWGDTFRPSYLRITTISEWFHSPQCVAFSATIDKKIEADVRSRLPLKKGFIRVVANPFRKNLHIEIEAPGIKEKRIGDRNLVARQRLFRLLQQEKQGAVLVYCYSRDRTASEYENVRDFARRSGYTPLVFHAGLLAEDKQRTLQQFSTADRPLVFCTTAFGMGIDRPDVRLVIHFDPPSTLVDYAQQIGRAGRDDLPARCVTFHDPRRIEQFDSHVKVGIPPIEFVERIYQRLVNAWRKAHGSLSLVGFQRQLEIMADKNSSAPDIYKQRAQRSLGILKTTGYICEESGPLTLKRLDRGSNRYTKLLELTEMALRRQVRETERLKQFFSAEQPSQELLWQIIGE